MLKFLEWTNKFLRFLLLASAVGFILLYLALVFFRIRYPFELEWQEGGTVDHVRRIIAGQSLYVAPSLDFVPYIYTPLYYYISAVVSLVFGVGLFSLRLVSFLSSLGCLILIYKIVARESGQRWPGLIAAGLFAATFRLSGAWYDLARVDSLFLCVTLAALYVIRFHESRASQLFAGLLITLAFLTKQTALIISLPLMAYALLMYRRRAIYLIGAVVVGVGASTLPLNMLSDGWYDYYVFILPGEHAILNEVYLSFWTQDIFAPLLVVLIASAAHLAILFLNAKREQVGAPAHFFAQFTTDAWKRFLFYFLVAIGMVGGAYSSRLHSGGFDNVLMPVYAILAILSGLALGRLPRLSSEQGGIKYQWMVFVLSLLFVVQFARLIYEPVDQIPDDKDLAAGNKWVATVAQIEGEVFVPAHGYLPSLAGKKSYSQEQAVRDILRSDRGVVQQTLTENIRQAIRTHKFSAIIVDQIEFDGQSDFFQADIQKYYRLQRVIFNSETVFYPVTGGLTRPQFVYVPR